MRNRKILNRYCLIWNHPELPRTTSSFGNPIKIPYEPTPQKNPSLIRAKKKQYSYPKKQPTWTPKQLSHAHYEQDHRSDDTLCSKLNLIIPSFIKIFRAAMRATSPELVDAICAHLDLLPDPEEFEDFVNEYIAELKSNENTNKIKTHII